MKLVFATSSNGDNNTVLFSEQPPHLLTSMLYLKGLKWLDYEPEYFLLDSGAFSVWKSGQEVTLNDYLPVAQKIQMERPLAWIINLDVIPGKVGQTATAGQVQNAMQESLHNADALRSYSLRGMEVFHMGEPFTFLDLLLDRRPSLDTVLGIAPRKDKSKQEQRRWLQNVLAHLVQRFGKEHLPRTHGLGVSNNDLLGAFPFYSADSSTWCNANRFGQIVSSKGTAQLISKSLPEGASRLKPVQEWATRYSVRSFRDMESQMTRLWQTRGIIWTD